MDRWYPSNSYHQGREQSDGPKRWVSIFLNSDITRRFAIDRQYPMKMNPYAPSTILTDHTRCCVLCGRTVPRTFSPFQRVRCAGCGCLLALKLSERWQLTLGLVLMAGLAGSVRLPDGIVQKSFVLTGTITLFFIAFSITTSIAGQLWPLRHGAFVSKRSLELARKRYRNPEGSD